MSRSKKVIINSATSLLLQGVNMISNMILPPLIIATFGSQINGLIAMIKEILRYIQVAGSGITDATVQSLYEPISKKDIPRINTVMATAKKLYGRAGIVFTTGLVIVAALMPVFMKEDINPVLVTLLVLTTGISGVSEYLWGGKYKTILVADQKAYIIHISQMLGTVFNVVVAYLLIKLDHGILVVQLCASMAYILRILLPMFYVRRRYKDITYKGDIDKAIARKRNDAAVHSIASLVVLNSQPIVVSIFLGLVETSIYSIYSTIFTGIILINTSISSAISATLGNVLSEKDKAKEMTIYSQYEYVFWTWTTFVYTVATVMIMPFMSIYAKGIDKAYINPTMAILFVSVGILRSVRLPALTMVNASGHFKETRKGAVLEAVLNIILQLVFINLWGIYGVIIASLISFGYRSYQLIAYVRHNLIQVQLGKMFGRLLRNMATGIIIVFVFRANLYVEHISFLELILKGAQVALTTGICVLGVNYISEKDTFKAVAKRIIKLFVK